MFFSFWLPIVGSAILVPLLLSRLYPVDKNSPNTQERVPRSVWANLFVVLAFNGIAILAGFLLGLGIQNVLFYYHQTPEYKHIILPELIIICLGAGFLVYGWVWLVLLKIVEIILGKEKAARFLASAEPDQGVEIDAQKMDKHAFYWVGFMSLIGVYMLCTQCLFFYIKVGKDKIVLRNSFYPPQKYHYQEIAKVRKAREDKKMPAHIITFKDGTSFDTDGLDSYKVAEAFAKFLPTEK